ncbi:hypothetical protein KC351_g14646 [Hortaea werneckii]|nr:hypothetical protein KC351_g14646 [Hortaea werneckii]
MEILLHIVSKPIKAPYNSFHRWLGAELVAMFHDYTSGDVAQAFVGIGSSRMDEVDRVYKLVSGPCQSGGFFERAKPPTATAKQSTPPNTSSAPASSLGPSTLKSAATTP